MPSPPVSLAAPPPSPPPSNLPHPSAVLDNLLRERSAVHPIRAAVPHLWALLDAEITRQLQLNPSSILPSTISTTTPPPTSTTTSANSPPQLIRSHTSPLPPTLKRIPSPISTPHKRLKIPVPADKFPEYNFVGRLLGPRGTTLKTLERDTRCKIMIRGKGSIRKDKEPEVRGKPGWEHVFNEPLHVVIELADHLEEPAASVALNRAKDAVEILLVPVPEERDALKRQQLRALAIMNGTYRGAPARNMDHLALSSYHHPHPHHPHHHPHLSSSHHHPHHPHPAASVHPSHSLSSFPDALNNAYLSSDPAMSAHVLSSPFDSLSPEDHPLFHSVPASAPPHASQPNLGLSLHPELSAERGFGRRSPSSGATSPNHPGSFGHSTDVHDLAALTASLSRCAVDDFTTSSVDDTPESSQSSDDGADMGMHPGSTDTSRPLFTGPPSTHVKVSSISPSTRPDTSLGVGGFIGREFYNGAFSNQSLSQSPWDQPVPTSSASLANSLYGLNNSPVPSPQVLTNPLSTVTPIERHHDGY